MTADRHDAAAPAALSIVPRPTSARRIDGEFVLEPVATIAAPAELREQCQLLQRMLQPATGFPLDIVEPGRGTIELEVDASLADEQYVLRVDEHGVVIRAGSPRGILWGCRSLTQLLPPAIYRSARTEAGVWALPHCVIDDAPRFAWRGLMLDVARHFLPPREVRRVIDAMAVHKLNTLHLHLTDDQGWRLQIDAFPLLTERGGWRSDSQRGHGPDATLTGRPHGGWYSKDDARELVAYAAERGITIIPEIEMPGHVQAALAAYPEWGIGPGPTEPWPHWGISTRVLNIEKATVDAFTRILDEVIEIFPSTFIGIGGDEAKKTEWESDARTRELMSERGLEDAEAAQSWFITQIDAHLAARGRRAYGWDEILEGGLAPGATVASWRGTYGAIAAARAGHDVVVCPDDTVYLDYRQSDLPGEPIPVGFPLGLDDVYAFDPLPHELTPEQARHVLGGQANMWSEHIDSPRTLDYMLFPRLCALAEAVWSVDKNLADFRIRLERHLPRLDALGIEYRHPEGPRPWQSRPDAPGKPITREERLAIQRDLVANIVTDLP